MGVDVLLYVLGVLVLVLGLAVSIALHELGHLIPAKIFKVEVTRYMIGFGPTLWSRRRGETEYGVKAIPLGGYIAMTGMYPPGEDDDEAPSRSSTTGFFNALVQEGSAMPAGEGGPLGHASAAGSSAPASREIVPGRSLPRAASPATPAGPSAVPDRSFYRLAVWKRVIVMLGGPFMNLVLATVTLGIILMGFGSPVATTTIASVSQCLVPAGSAQSQCGPGDAQAPAATAGIQPGDTIVAIDGVQNPSWDQVSAAIEGNAGSTIPVVVERGGERVSLSLTPALTAKAVYDSSGRPVKGADGATRTQDVGMAGITPTSTMQQQPVTAVLPAVGDALGQTVNLVMGLPQRLVDVWNAAFGGGERDPNGPMSVVGVGRVAGEIAASDQAPVSARVQGMLGLVASLNIALFVFNLVPLPPLDGGHIVVALFDGARRGLARLFKRRDPGPVNGARLVPVTLTIVVILGAMSLLLMYADIVNPVNLLG